MAIEFTKMHGLGNDFVVVDLLTQRAELDPERIRALADRHTGIGFDQLLVAEAPSTPDADFRYRIFNTDGSEAEQCGNGARCIARFVRDRQLTRKRRIVFEVPRGLITCQMHSEDQVEVDMGEPVFDPVALPFVATAGAALVEGGAHIRLGTEELEVTLVSMGNPHAVLFVDDIAATEVDRLGAALQQHPCFPESVNVGFCQIVDSGFLRLRVYERGVGETRACGSGACAAVAAAQRHGRCQGRVKVSLPGGKLRLAWQGPGHPITMAGPTAVVFEGRVDL
ncbi:MAG: diaminopimelate epimerase [Pseudomonadales bacterium]|jgi:diaminopimelate epimerase|nr:diaminopimelate epimerase [Pseudomonadales bacterium]